MIYNGLMVFRLLNDQNALAIWTQNYQISYKLIKLSHFKIRILTERYVQAVQGSIHKEFRIRQIL